MVEAHLCDASKQVAFLGFGVRTLAWCFLFLFNSNSSLFFCYYYMKIASQQTKNVALFFGVKFIVLNFHAADKYSLEGNEVKCSIVELRFKA